jgi:hypothetical protein
MTQCATAPPLAGGALQGSRRAFAFVVVPKLEAAQCLCRDIVFRRMAVDAAVVFILVQQRSGPAVLHIPEIDHGFGIRAFLVETFLPGFGPEALPLFLQCWQVASLRQRLESPARVYARTARHRTGDKRGRFPAIIPRHQIDRQYFNNSPRIVHRPIRISKAGDQAFALICSSEHPHTIAGPRSRSSAG